MERFRKLENVGDVRQRGFMVGIEMVRDKATKEEYPPGAKMGIRVTMEARKRGVILRPLSNVMVLMPPLTISEGELRELLDVTYDSIVEVMGEMRGETS